MDPCANQESCCLEFHTANEIGTRTTIPAFQIGRHPSFWCWLPVMPFRIHCRSRISSTSNSSSSSMFSFDFGFFVGCICLHQFGDLTSSVLWYSALGILDRYPDLDFSAALHGVAEADFEAFLVSYIYFFSVEGSRGIRALAHSIIGDVPALGPKWIYGPIITNNITI